MMRSKIILIVVIGILFTGCRTYKNIPKHTEIDTDQYGSLIEINYRSDEYVEGELISVAKDSIVVLNSENNSCLVISKNQIYKYRLRFAVPKHYSQYIPILTLSTLSHGFIAMITFPINLVTTIVVAATGETAYSINQDKLPYEKLSMYARFPQGVPEGIPLYKIKN